MTTTSIDRHVPVSGTAQALEILAETAKPGSNPGRPETQLRAAVRRRGITMKELAAKMGVSASHLSQIATGRKPWTPKMREKAAALLGDVPGQGVVYRQGGVVSGESSYIRERARELGMSMQGPGRACRGVLWLHDAGVPWLQEHGREGPGAGGVGVGGSGEGCPCEVRGR